MNLSLLDLWHSMGYFAKGIVWVLAIMSVYSLTIMIQKWWGLRKAQQETRKFAPEFSQFLEEDNLTEAIKLAEGYKKSHVARVLGGALSEIKPLILDGSVTVADINSAERAVEREMLMTIVQLKRGLGVLGTVGATAPFVGLLGTTMGIVNAFTGMAASGSGGLSAISAGVAEGLIYDGTRPPRRHSGGVGLQLLPDEDRQPHGRDDVLVEGNDRLPHQGRVRRVRPLALHA
jgi:biopolymer transport protein ExbB/biopolymer transport protein TolQ